jgi:outer membrane protein, multidrug efflux system
MSEQAGAGRLFKISPLLAVALLAACTTAPQPPAAEPIQGVAPGSSASWQAPLPPNLQSAAATASAAPLDASLWWRSFGDPVLLSLQQAAQAASPNLSAAKSRIEQARAGLVAAQARGLPALDASAAARYGRDLPGTPRSSSLSVGAQASWELDLFGGIAAGSAAAAQRLQAAQAGWHDARTAVAAETAGSYFALRACEGQVAQARTDAASRTETARLTELSVRAGLQAPANGALATASAAQGQAVLTQTQAQCDALVKALVALTALPEPELRAQLKPGQAKLAQEPVLGAAGVPAQLLQRRPDVFAAAREVQAAAAEVQQAAAQQLPRLSFSGQIGALRIAPQGAPSSSGSTFAIGPVAVSLPLFDAGQRLANSAAAQARYDDAVLQLQARLRQAVRETEEALLSLSSTAARDADAKRAAAGFEANLRAADARFRGGLGSLFELEDARRSAASAQSALIELQRERAIAWVSLYRALGGGFDASQNLAATDTK